MRVDRIQSEKPQKSNAASIAKAGVLGSVGGALVRNFAPLTTQEHDVFFNSAAVEAIKNKGKNARINEANRLVDEIINGRIAISEEAKDIFTSKASIMAVKPESAADYLKNASGTAKKEVGGLLLKAASVGAAREHTEITSIKNAAKANRSLAYFMLVGALLTMSTQLIVNAFKSAAPKEEAKKSEHEDLTMADVLLDGLGSNTEVLFLASESKNK